MSLEQTIKDTLLAESVDLDMRLQQLVRSGLMPVNTIPLLRKAITKVQGGYPLVGAERDVMANFLNAMMFIVLGDDVIFNKARTGAKSYAMEETEELEEKRGLWDNIHAKRKRIKAGSGERMRKPGSEGAPSDADLKNSRVNEGENKEMKDKDPCWKGYQMVGMKKKGGREVPNCVPANEEVEQIDEISKTTLKSYSTKAEKQTRGNQPHGKDALRKRTNREKGLKSAYNKYYGFKTKVAATEEKQSRRAEALADIASITQMNESYRSTFNAALTQYGIKSPSELDEEKRKEFFNFVDQNYKKGDN